MTPILSIDNNLGKHYNTPYEIHKDGKEIETFGFILRKMPIYDIIRQEND